MNFTFNELFVGGFNLSTALLGGGLLGVVLVFLIGKRVMAEINAARSSWGNMLRFLAAWTIVPALILGAGRMIYGEINQMISANVNSQSMQALGTAGNQLTYALDKMVGFAPGDGGGQSYGGNTQQAAFQLKPLVGGQPGTQSASGEPIVGSVNAPVAAPVAVPANAPFQPLLGQPQVVPAPTLAPLQKVNMVGTTVTVLPGDSLAAISKRAYGTTDGWRDIYAANQAAIGSNPNAISAGMQLVIPAKGSQSGAQLIAINAAAPAAPAQAPAALAADGRVYYDVAIPTPVPAQLSVEAYQGHLQRVPVSAPAVVQPVVIQPTPTRIVIVPTPAPVMVVAVKPGLELGRPSVDTSAPSLGASGSNSGTTVTVGN